MSTGALVGVMALFVVLGAPLVFYLWITLNQLLTAQVDGMRTLLALPVLLLFLGLLAILSRSIRRWDQRLHT